MISSIWNVFLQGGMFPSRALTPEGVRLRDKPAKDTAVRGTMCSFGVWHFKELSTCDSEFQGLLLPDGDPAAFCPDSWLSSHRDEQGKHKPHSQTPQKPHTGTQGTVTNQPGWHRASPCWGHTGSERAVECLGMVSPADFLCS